MKWSLLLIIFASCLLGCSQQTQPASAPSTQATTPDAALQSFLAEAKKENKLLLLDFTGSDWCPPCIKMDKEYFSSQRFADFAKAHLVMVKLDFPRRKELPKAERERNEALAARFEIEGFPTLILLGPEGQVLWRITGMPESLGSLLAELEKAVETKAAAK